jgi:hypothetical protein
VAKRGFELGLKLARQALYHNSLFSVLKEVIKD